MYYNQDKRALYDRWQKPGESISFGYETAGKWVRAMKAQGISFRLYMNDIFRISSFKEERGTDYPFSKSVSLSVGVRF